jgi:RNA polymerase sigma-70 factor (ECF subfamily)
MNGMNKMHESKDREKNWIRRARQGDQRAFEYLIDAYQRPVFNLCFRMLGNFQQAEDAAQEVFYKTFCHLNRYDPNRSFVNWILSIASHYCIDQLRRRKIAAISLTNCIERIVNPGPGPEDEIVQHELTQLCQSLLNRLDPLDRAALLLFYWHSCSHAEIGEALQLSAPAVKSRLHRSRKRLAEFLVSQESGLQALEPGVFETEFTAAARQSC